MQGGACTGEGKHVRPVLAVAGEHRGDDLRVLLEALWEERTKWAVDDATGENLFFSLATFTLEEAAWNAAGCVRLFDELTGERKEVETRTLVSADRRHEHHRVTVGNEHGTMCLLGKPTGFKGELAAPQHHRFTNKHGLTSRV